jgi:hypothetical protein
MTGIPAPPKVSPSVIVLTGRDAAMFGARAIAEAQIAKAGLVLATADDAPRPEPPKLDLMAARRAPVPAGYKRVYHGHTPHQGSKETLRRQRQQDKAAIQKTHEDLKALLAQFVGRDNTPEVREEITRITVAYVESQAPSNYEIAQVMADAVLAKMEAQA